MLYFPSSSCDPYRLYASLCRRVMRATIECFVENGSRKWNVNKLYRDNWNWYCIFVKSAGEREIPITDRCTRSWLLTIPAHFKQQFFIIITIMITMTMVKIICPIMFRQVTRMYNGSCRSHHIILSLLRTLENSHVHHPLFVPSN